MVLSCMCELEDKKRKERMEERSREKQIERWRQRKKGEKENEVIKRVLSYEFSLIRKTNENWRELCDKKRTGEQ